MKSNNDIKTCVHYYFDDIINGTKINVSNILLDKKIYENFSVYNILYKILMGPKPLSIRFNEVDGFVILNLNI